MSARRIGKAGRRLGFTFDGRRLEGNEGDTIASALLAANVRIVGRSFKYHRPRGIFGAWTEEPNALVDVSLGGRTTPNLRATTEMLAEGMDIRPVNAVPSAAADRFAILDRAARFLPAGFYYKTFIWPDWHLFEPRIRAMAGLGRLDPANASPADNPVVNLACAVLVVGGGPAGLAAALDAAGAGGEVILVDDGPVPGGTMLYRHSTGPAQAAVLAAEAEAAGVKIMARTTAWGIHDHGLVCCWQRRDGAPDRQLRIRPGRIVLAAGAIERPLVFPDNDRPGVMSAQAALFYLRRHGVLAGERIVLAASNSHALEVVAPLREAGAQVIVADLREGAAIDAVHGRRGVEAVTISGRRVEADCLLVSGGFTPSVHLFCQAGGRLRYDEAICAFVPGDPVAGMSVVGAAAGDFGDYAIAPAWPQPGVGGRQWIDFQNDVTLKDVALAARENFRSVEHLKRYTTLGMATDQGKTSNMNGLAAMAALTGRGIAETGTTTYRPPFVPVPLPVVAGRRRGQLFSPVKRLPLEAAHRASGACFREYGGWLRPAFYGHGDPRAQIAREARQARETVAIFDGSPLGKIEVIGPQAASLVDYNSYQTLSTLKEGRIRYGLMLTEGGAVYDDGVTLRLAQDHFVVSCSSGHVPGVALRLQEWRQDRFDPAQVFVHDLTAHWATLTATGPRARALVAALSLGIGLDDAALPHMAVATGSFEGAPARVARVSFTGDRSYEISVPASKAPALWLAMAEAGRELDAVLLGSEALLLLRAEKGFIVVGKDTDGTTMPQDLGLAGPRDRRKGEFVGKRSLFTSEAARPDRRQFVGLTVAGGEDPLPTGGHVVDGNGGHRRSAGYVTSSYFSPTLGRPVALGLVERGLEREGEEIDIFHLGAMRRAVIAAACAFDPAGARLDA